MESFESQRELLHKFKFEYLYCKTITFLFLLSHDLTVSFEIVNCSEYALE